MMNTFKNRAQIMSAPATRVLLVCSLVFALAACAKDSDDGDVVDSVTLPTDIAFDLFCEDVGLFTETCVLDDPDNPYARTNVNNGNKFDLSTAAPSGKARVYLWATAQARSPSGENQFYAAQAFHELFTETVTAAPPGSAQIRDQAIRAYRSLLDNYFDSSTFFPASFVPDPGIFFPVPLAPETAFALALSGPNAPLFFADPGSNEFAAREIMGSWGYTWVGMIERPAPNPPIPGPVLLN